jgi:hypothetical protein
MTDTIENQGQQFPVLAELASDGMNYRAMRDGLKNAGIFANTQTRDFLGLFTEETFSTTKFVKVTFDDFEEYLDRVGLGPEDDEANKMFENIDSWINAVCKIFGLQTCPASASIFLSQAVARKEIAIDGDIAIGMTPVQTPEDDLEGTSILIIDCGEEGQVGIDLVYAEDITPYYRYEMINRCISDWIFVRPSS